MKKYRFVGNGTYGGRSRAAAVPYIGDLYRGDEVLHDEEAKLLRFTRPCMEPLEATEQRLTILRGTDFNAEVSCEHRFASGDACAKRPLDGSKFCAFHDKMNQKAQSAVERIIVPNKVPLPPELVSDPMAVLLESVEKNAKIV